MQDASINDSDSANYGSGTAANNGSGQTSMGNSGIYEYVVATNSVALSGGTLNFRGAGSGNGLVNNYTSAAATASSGQRRFQVVRVPQYANVTLSSTLTALEWNGRAGGVVALDVAGDLNFNGSTINTVNKGFRAGYSFKNSSGNSTTTYVVPVSSNTGAGKGEGTAGTPRYVWNGTTPVDNGSDGYPGGDLGRGAPANAGGGGNAHNAGGGGGGNGGIGGQGGLPWEGVGGALDAGGRPGAFSSTYAAAPWRLLMGGGGGGGDANNATTGIRGGVGGGITILRAGQIAGSGTILANGDDGDTGEYGGHPDGAGGGGAGGTVLLLTRNSSPTANISIQANGGRGGNTKNDTNDAHGPGGGGGGGVVVYNVPGSSITTNVDGGASGKTGGGTGAAHGSIAGSSGQVSSFTAANDPFATVNSAGCFPQLTVTKSTNTANVIAGDTATYTITASNGTGRADATNVSISDMLPDGFTYASTSAVNVSGGASRTATNNPTIGAADPTWDSFTIPAGGRVSITFTVKVDSSVAAKTYQNPATANHLDPVRTTETGTATATYDPASSTGEDVTVGARNPNLVLVKRITAINGEPIDTYVDDTVDNPATPKNEATFDNDSNWPNPKDTTSGISTYLRGAIDGGKVKPGEQVEYTIYFLSGGNTPITNVNACDLVPANTTFVANAFNSMTPNDGGLSGTDSGIAFALGSTTPTYLTNVNDAPDRGQYFLPGMTPSVNCSGANTNGAVVVKVVASPATLPNATAPGTPANSYGFVRFVTKVK